MGTGSFPEVGGTSHGKGPNGQADDESSEILFPRRGNLGSAGRLDRYHLMASPVVFTLASPSTFWVGCDLFRVYIQETIKPIKSAAGCPTDSGSQLENGAGDSHSLPSPAQSFRAEL